MKAFFCFTFIALSLFSLLGCNYNATEGVPILEDGVQSFNLPLAQQEMLSFDYVYQNVFQPKCVSCHDKSDRVNLQSYDEILPRLADIKRTVFIIKTMPKQGHLNDEQKAILWTWLDRGAPKETLNKSGTPLPPAAQLTATFESISKLVFEEKCVSCHSAGKSAKRILLDKQSLLNSPLELVIPNNPDESGLVLAIERNDSNRMPPAKEGFAKLSDLEITAIRTWINNGATD
jgi:mono/diheme cytochrome c family protein